MCLDNNMKLFIMFAVGAIRRREHSVTWDSLSSLPSGKQRNGQAGRNCLKIQEEAQIVARFEPVRFVLPSLHLSP